MKKIRMHGAVALAAVVGLGMATSAHAYWTLDVGNPTNVAGSAAGDAKVTATGYYAANGANNNGFASTSTKWVSGALTDFAGNGLGMYSGTDSGEPTHAIDNNGNTEAVLLSFTSSVVLSSIGIGYKNTDADISLFYYTGTTAPTLTTATATLSGMQSAGWALVGNYGDLQVDTSNPYTAVNAGNLSSSWWLITAYNASYGTVAQNGGSLGQGNDYFKLYAVAGTTTTTTNTGNRAPEPASLALVAVGLLGAAGVGRRRSAKASDEAVA